MQPLNNGIIVELVDTSETTTGSGIILKNDVSVTQLAIGTVVYTTSSIKIAPGDTVRFSKWKGVRFEEKGKTLVYLKSDDILIKD